MLREIAKKVQLGNIEVPAMTFGNSAYLNWLRQPAPIDQVAVQLRGLGRGDQALKP
jgi:hypothetical protein